MGGGTSILFGTNTADGYVVVCMLVQAAEKARGKTNDDMRSLVSSQKGFAYITFTIAFLIPSPCITLRDTCS